MVRLTDRPDMTLDVYRGRKTTMQHRWELTASTKKRHKTGILFYFILFIYFSLNSQKLYPFIFRVCIGNKDYSDQTADILI